MLSVQVTVFGFDLKHPFDPSVSLGAQETTIIHKVVRQGDPQGYPKLANVYIAKRRDSIKVSRVTQFGRAVKDSG